MDIITAVDGGQIVQHYDVGERLSILAAVVLVGGHMLQRVSVPENLTESQIQEQGETQ